MMCREVPDRLPHATSSIAHATWRSSFRLMSCEYYLDTWESRNTHIFWVSIHWVSLNWPGNCYVVIMSLLKDLCLAPSSFMEVVCHSQCKELATFSPQLLNVICDLLVARGTKSHLGIPAGLPSETHISRHRNQKVFKPFNFSFEASNLATVFNPSISFIKNRKNSLPRLGGFQLIL